MEELKFVYFFKLIFDSLFNFRFVEREEAAKLAAAAARNDSNSNSMVPPNDMRVSQQPSPYRVDR